MELPTVLHMTGGDGKNSYSRNSSTQRSAFANVIPILEETTKTWYTKSFPEHFVIADLGCSSGPNALFAISTIINNILDFCKQKNKQAPELMVFLNDLPSNDFNSVFRLLPEFHRKIKEDVKGDNNQTGSTCFVSAMPGSFYGRLFPVKSVHLFHSSCSLHWLSQVPEGIENNKANICLSKTSPHNVLEAYTMQFHMDFSIFMSSRSEELVPGGHMVLMLLARKIYDASSIDCCKFWNLLATSLLDMAKEGLIQEDLIDSFNLPFYTPHPREVTKIVEEEGSFEVNHLETFELGWDLSDNNDNPDYVLDNVARARTVAGCVRATSEPLLTCHFGQGNLDLDDLFERYMRHIGEYLSMEDAKYFFLIISLTRKRQCP